jgi:hypothetical protein
LGEQGQGHALRAALGDARRHADCVGGKRNRHDRPDRSKPVRWRRGTGGIEPFAQLTSPKGCAVVAEGHMGVRKEAEKKLKEEFALARSGWNLMTFYQKFEHLVILLLTALISVVVALAVWNLTVKIVSSVFTTGFDPTDYAVFQSLFGMVFTVIIAQSQQSKPVDKVR